MPLPGGFSVGRGVTVYGAFSAASREANAYLDHERLIRDAEGNNVKAAQADIAYWQKIGTSIPAAGGIGLTIRELAIDPIGHALTPGWTSVEDVQNILRSSQQGAEKAGVIKRATDFRRSVGNASYLSQDVNDMEQSRREREVAREEQRQRIRDNQTAQVEQLNKERERRMAGDIAGEAARLTKSGGFTVTEADVRNSIQRDYNDATRKVSAQTASEMALNDARFAGEASREYRERTARFHGTVLESQMLGASISGDTDKARRLGLQRELEQGQFAANQQSPEEGQFFAQNIAPQRRLELEKQINSERVLEARQSQDRINDAVGEGEEAMLAATRHHYEAVAHVLKRSVDDQVKSLRERADAEQDLTRKAQLNAEANAAQAAGQVRINALNIQQQQEMQDRAAGVNARSDVTELRTQHRNYEAARLAVQRRYEGALRHLDPADSEGRAAADRERRVDLGAIEEDRRRSLKDIRNQTGVMALENTHRPYSAQLKAIQDKYDRQIEDATGDPVRQGALGRQRDEAIDALHQQLKRRTSFRSSMTDIYFGLLGSSVADTGDFAKRAADARAVFEATGKLDKAAQKLLDSKPVTIIR